MRKFLIISGGFILGIVFLYLIKVPSYVELNNLAIIEGIGIDCSSYEYKVFLKEIIPKKSENGIQYDYHIYKGDGKKNVSDSLKNIEDNTKKKLYYNEVKYVITNCDNSSEIRKKLEMDLDYVKHIKGNIYKYLDNIKEK